mmetsp:Transcript_32722/g.101272  ORF Transcript_32722/g.101272 Transcript_32722/m.101272 type:complete len:1367 (-) Transcript_32722:74-4174(-)
MGPNFLSKYAKFLSQSEPKATMSPNSIPIGKAICATKSDPQKCFKNAENYEQTDIHLVSPWRCSKNLQALLGAEMKLDSTEKNPLPAIAHTTIEAAHLSKRSIWEQKLGLLEHLRRKCHERRPDAAWHWHESDTDTRRRERAINLRERAAQKFAMERYHSPAHTQAIAVSVASLVAQVDQRLQTRTATRPTWAHSHPATGHERLIHMDSSDVHGSCVDLDYAEAFLSTNGYLLPLKKHAPGSDSAKSSVNAGFSTFPAATLSLKLSLRLPSVLEKGHGAQSHEYLDSRARHSFDYLLLLDVVKFANLPKSTVALDEIALVRRGLDGEAQISLGSFSATYSASRSKAAEHWQRALQSCTPRNARPIHKQQCKKKTLMGWTKSHDNIVNAKLTIVGTGTFDACNAASSIALAANDAASPLRRFGSICSCCIDGSVQVIQELRERSWPQYWTFLVSPVFFGYKTREFRTNSRGRIPKHYWHSKSKLARWKLHAFSVLDGCNRAKESKTLKANREERCESVRLSVFMRLKLKKRKRMIVQVRCVKAQDKVIGAALRYRRQKLVETKQKRVSAQENAQWWHRIRMQPTILDGSPYETSKAPLNAQLHKTNAHRSRAISWRAKYKALRHWFSEILPQGKFLADFFPVERRVEEANGQNDLLLLSKRHKKTYRDMETTLLWLHRELSEVSTNSMNVDNRSYLPKQELFVALCEASASYPQCGVFAALVQRHEFAMSFLLMPVEQTGYITEAEFVVFGLVVSDILKLHSPENDAPRASETFIQSTYHYSDSTGCLPTNSHVDQQSTSREQSHSHIFVRLGKTPEYCCICRRSFAHVQNTAFRPCIEPSQQRQKRFDSKNVAQGKVARLLQNIVESLVQEKGTKIVSSVLNALVYSIVLPHLPYTRHARSTMKLGCLDVSRAHIERASAVATGASVHVVQCARLRGMSNVDELVTCLAMPNDVLLHPPMTCCSSVCQCVAVVAKCKLSRGAFHIVQLQIQRKGLVLGLEGENMQLNTCNAICLKNLEIGRANGDSEGEWTLLQQQDRFGVQRMVPQANGDTKACMFEQLCMATEERQFEKEKASSSNLLEQPMLFKQEEARQALHSLVGKLSVGERSFVARLEWLEALSFRAHIMHDPASGRKHTIRFLSVKNATGAQRAISLADKLCNLRCRNMVQFLAAYSHAVTSFNLQGTCSETWILVIFITSYSNINLATSLNACRGVLEPHTVRGWGKDVARTLAMMHGCGISHQNINPAAFQLDGHGQIILDDFLFTHNTGQSSSRSNYQPFAELLPPEAMLDSDSASPQADVWALGCCMYHWLTGVLPAMYNRPLDSVLGLIPGKFSGPIVSAIDLALQPHPATRASAEDLVRILSQ